MSDDTLTTADFRALLRLQEVDITIDQAKARRHSLPGHAVVTSVQKEAADLRPRLQEAAAARDELQRRQDALDAEVSQVERRIKDLNSRLYDSSSKIGPTDALAMTQEVRHLQERKSKLEDGELELMEATETANEVVAPLEQQAQGLAGRMQQANAEIVQGQQQIDAELATLEEQRSKALTVVPPSLIAEYEKLQRRLGVVAVASLVGNACGGCHLTMSATEVSALRAAPDSALLHCEECDRLLVR